MNFVTDPDWVGDFLYLAQEKKLCYIKMKCKNLERSVVNE